MTSFFVGTAADYFVVRGFSLGARVLYDHLEESGYSADNSVSIGPRIGYDVPLGDHASLWPVLFGSYSNTWIVGNPLEWSVAVGAYVPVLYHPAPHFFLGIGRRSMPQSITSRSTPQWNTDALRTTTYGISATVGGWGLSLESTIAKSRNRQDARNSQENRD